MYWSLAAGERNCRLQSPSDSNAIGAFALAVTLPALPL